VGHYGETAAIPQEEAYNFYMEAQRTVAPAYENRMTLQSVPNMVEYNPDFAVHLAAPTALLMVHAQQDMIPVDLVREVFSRVREPKNMAVLDCRHTDLLAGDPWLSQAAGMAVEWFKTYLSS
jgi:hypothetical protein